MSIPIVLSLVLSLLPWQSPDPPPGRRIDLDGATLFIPEAYRPRDGRVDVVFHLHGAPAIVEAALVSAGWKAVLVEFNRKGLSSVYSAPFSDPKLFPALLDRVLREVEREGLAEKPRPGRVLVSSFSAGFGGVRELLKVPESFDRIDALVLADSLYCGYAGDKPSGGPDPEKMAGFRRFAAEAAAGRKTMLVSHSAQIPDGYASTTETADDLIRSVGGVAEPTRVDRGDGWSQTRGFREGRLVVLGFSGSEADDHMRHLRRIAELWKALPDPFDP